MVISRERKMSGLLRALVLLLLLLSGLGSVPGPAADAVVDAEVLAKLPPLPAEYKKLPYTERVAWLKQHLLENPDPARRYQLNQELAYQYYYNSDNVALDITCHNTPPLKTDRDYRFICIDGVKPGYEDASKRFLELYEDAAGAADDTIAVQTLLSLGWLQSENGEISAAFRSYELALSQVDRLNFYLRNDVIVNTATLYIVHGDREYIDRGIQLLEENIERLEQKKREDPNLTDFVDASVALIRHNLGIAYALHVHDYAKALSWFRQLGPEDSELWRSALVFSALSAEELGQGKLAENYLKASDTAAPAKETDTGFLSCYQQLIRLKLALSKDFSACTSLSEQTPLEVRLDLYKRMSVSKNPGMHLAGVENLATLFTTSLEPQLKQSSTKAASRAELIRLQQESKLKSELIAKEKALKRAEEDKHRNQVMFALAVTIILLLFILIIIIRLVQKRKLAQQYEQMSIIDGLTGLNNRRFFEQNIERELNFIRRARRDGRSAYLAIYLMDIDYFKNINDTYGHDVGDQVLQAFAQRVNHTIRETDMLIRWGGEEFLLVARVESQDNYHTIAERIRTIVVQEVFAIPGRAPLQVSCTIGGMVYPCATNAERSPDWRAMIQLADAALYYGKRKQRNCWVCIDQLRATPMLESCWESGLDIALEKGLVGISSSLNSV